jgi:BCD family chlorophyll transporter-like MFS transporter
MSIRTNGQTGLALGAWGAVQATAAGTSVALGGIICDTVGGIALGGGFGPEFVDPALGYSVVYHLEIALLFATLVAIGPLVRAGGTQRKPQTKFGLAELPG